MPLREFAFGVLFILPDEGKFDSIMAALNGDMVKSIFDSFNNAVEQQKKASEAFFSDKGNLDNIINIVKQEKSKNE